MRRLVPVDSRTQDWPRKTADAVNRLGGRVDALELFKAPSHTKSSLPAPSLGGVIFVPDEAGGATLAFSDGAVWRRVQDRAVVS